MAFGGFEVLFEGTSSHAAASFTWWDAAQWWVCPTEKTVCAVVFLVGPIPAHAVVAAIENGRIDGIIGGFCPVPILHRVSINTKGIVVCSYGKIILVSALCAKSRLVSKYIVSMPSEKIRLAIISSESKEGGSHEVPWHAQS